MKKRFASVALILALTTLLALPALGAESASNAYEPYAERLSALGVFKGTNGGFELERTPQRSEGVAMLVRLMGAEEEALAMKDEELPFNDADGWARGYIAYVWKNQLANGVGGASFGTSHLIEAQSFTTLILRSLGYSDKEEDFTYSSAVEFAVSIGLFDQAFGTELTGTVFHRGQIARICYEALRYPVKGTETRLAEKLAADGKLDAAAVTEFLAADISSAEKAEPTDGTVPAQPQNLRVVKEEADSVYLQFDPVEGADYYYFYYSLAKEESFIPYEDAAGEQMRYEHKEEWSIQFSGLPGGVYEVCVTAVKNGVESDYNDTLVFTKAGGTVASDVAYYAEAPWCPDFGALTGSRLTSHNVNDDGTIHAYYYVVAGEGLVTQYDELLISLGYVYDWAYAEELTAFYVPVAYVHPVTYRVIVIDVDKITGEFMIYTS